MGMLQGVLTVTAIKALDRFVKHLQERKISGRQPKVVFFWTLPQVDGGTITETVDCEKPLLLPRRRNYNTLKNRRNEPVTVKKNSTAVTGKTNFAKSLNHGNLFTLIRSFWKFRRNWEFHENKFQRKQSLCSFFRETQNPADDVGR